MEFQRLEFIKSDSCIEVIEHLSCCHVACGDATRLQEDMPVSFSKGHLLHEF